MEHIFGYEIFKRVLLQAPKNISLITHSGQLVFYTLYLAYTESTLCITTLLAVQTTQTIQELICRAFAYNLYTIQIYIPEGLFGWRQ